MLTCHPQRRRWTATTDAVFAPADRRDEFVYGPEENDRDLDFQDCGSIAFFNGKEARGEDFLMSAKGNGHVSLPAGVQVRVTSGSVKLASPPS